jgi:hypothetical protein
MPIRPIKSPAPEASEPAAPTPRSEVPSPSPRRRPSLSALPSTPEIAAEAGDRSSHQNGAKPADSREQKPKKKKKKPTGDYDVGFCKTPIESRFKVGNPGGPGRKRGSLSQDTYLRKELDEKRTLRINGRERRLSTRELATKLLIEAALKKQEIKHLELVVAHARRLFPDAAPVDVHDAALPDAAFDEDILRQLFAGLSMGEPDPDYPNSWTDLIDQPPLGRDAENNCPDDDETVEDGVTAGEDGEDGEWGDDDGE